MQYELIRMIQQKIDALEPGQDFNLPNLLGPAWEKMSDGAATGKEFKELVRDQRDIAGVRLINDKVSPALYRKKGQAK